MRNEIEHNYQTYANISDFGFCVGAVCLPLSRCDAFFRDLFFGTSGVLPWTDLGLPWGTLGQILSTLWKMLVANVLRNSKIPEQHMSPTTPSTKNKQEFKALYRQSIQTSHLLFL